MDTFVKVCMTILLTAAIALSPMPFVAGSPRLFPQIRYYDGITTIEIPLEEFHRLKDAAGEPCVCGRRKPAGR